MERRKVGRSTLRKLSIRTKEGWLGWLLLHFPSPTLTAYPVIGPCDARNVYRAAGEFGGVPIAMLIGKHIPLCGLKLAVTGVNLSIVQTRDNVLW